MQAAAQTSANVTTLVTRAEEAWAYIYTLLGFALTIEAGVVALIEPLKWPWNLLAYVVAAVVTLSLFADNGWFQKKLLGLKTKYDNKLR